MGRSATLRCSDVVEDEHTRSGEATTAAAAQSEVSRNHLTRVRGVSRSFAIRGRMRQIQGLILGAAVEVVEM